MNFTHSSCIVSSAKPTFKKLRPRAASYTNARASARSHTHANSSVGAVRFRPSVGWGRWVDLTVGLSLQLVSARATDHGPRQTEQYATSSHRHVHQAVGSAVLASQGPELQCLDICISKSVQRERPVNSMHGEACICCPISCMWFVMSVGSLPDELWTTGHPSLLS